MKKVIIFLVLTSAAYCQSPIKPQQNLTFSRNLNFQNTIQDGKKSIGLAMVYSFLLPGMGELYAESYSSGKYYTIADGVLWATLIGFSSYGSWQRNNFQSFALSNGGVVDKTKKDDFWADIGNYKSIFEFNAEKELQRDFANRYNMETHFWDWGNNGRRQEYRRLWKSSENAFNNIRFVVGALLVNRIISVINAIRLVKAYNKNISDKLTWNISVDFHQPQNQPSELRLSFFKILN